MDTCFTLAALPHTVRPFFTSFLFERPLMRFDAVAWKHKGV